MRVSRERPAFIFLLLTSCDAFLSFCLLIGTQLFLGSSLPSSPFFHDSRLKGLLCRTAEQESQCALGSMPSWGPAQCHHPLPGALIVGGELGGRRGGALCKAPFVEGPPAQLQGAGAASRQAAGLAPWTEAAWLPLLQGQRAGTCRRRPLHSPALGWPALPQACLRGQLLHGARPAFSSVPF